MSLHPHQHRALVDELRGRAYDGTPDDAFALVASTPALKALGTTRFLTQAEYDALRDKDRVRLGRACIITDAERAAFPGGLPGFPNKLRREWFDAAWAEARG